MYGIFAYIWLRFIEHVGKYTIHGSFDTILWESLPSQLETLQIPFQASWFEFLMSEAN